MKKKLFIWAIAFLLAAFSRVSLVCATSCLDLPTCTENGICNITEGCEISGTHSFTDFFIGDGVTVNVTGNLVLYSSNSLVIEGTLNGKGSDGTGCNPGGNGKNIDIFCLSGALCRISGKIIASGGNGASTGNRCWTSKPHGGNGGYIGIVGDIIEILGELRVEGGNGGRFCHDHDCDSYGSGNGGNGGRIWINGYEYYTTRIIKIDSATISVKGGRTAYADHGDRAGDAGTIEIENFKEIEINNSNLYAYGGYSGGKRIDAGSGNNIEILGEKIEIKNSGIYTYGRDGSGDSKGGDGGDVYINASKLLAFSGSTINANAGRNCQRYYHSQCHDEREAGDVNIIAYRLDKLEGSISAQGADGGCEGGKGGDVLIDIKEVSGIVDVSISTNGGGCDCSYCSGGDAGKIEIYNVNFLKLTKTLSAKGGSGRDEDGSDGLIRARFCWMRGSTTNVKSSNVDLTSLPEGECPKIEEPLEPVTTLLELHGRVKSKDGSLLSQGSLRVEIEKDGETVWGPYDFNNVIKNGLFKLRIGDIHELTLIPLQTYKLHITVSDQVTFTCTASAKCEEFEIEFMP